MNAKIALSRFPRLAPFVAQVASIYILCLAGHWLWVSLYGVDLPILDQWEAEIYYLQALAKAGTLDFAHIVYPWNEHRIAVTRLISLALFTLNHDQFDGLVECYTNAAIFALMPCLILCGLEWKNRNFGRTAVIAAFAICLSWLPYDFENTLIGFQNQFYLMELSAILLIAMAAWARVSPLLWLLSLSVAALSCFTMASGLIGALAAAIVLLVRQFTEKPSKAGLALAAALVISFLTSLYFIPRVPANHQFAATGMIDHLRALVFVLSWPLSSHKWLFPILWLPAAITLGLGVYARRLTPNQMMALGLCCWTLLQAVAIAHSRGHNLIEIPSRYSDIMTAGLIANAWLAMDIRMYRLRTRAVIAAALVNTLFGIVATYALIHRTPTDFVAMTQHYQRQLDGTQNLRHYLAGRDMSALDPPAMIPLPDSNRLKLILQSKEVREVLPPSIRPGLASFVEGPSSPEACSASAAALLRPGHPLATKPVETDFPYLLVVTTSAPATGANGKPLSECSFPDTSSNPRDLSVATRHGSFRVEAQTRNGGAALLAAPVEMGSLSLVALNVRRAVCHGASKHFSASCQEFGQSGRSLVTLSTIEMSDPPRN